MPNGLDAKKLTKLFKLCSSHRPRNRKYSQSLVNRLQRFCRVDGCHRCTMRYDDTRYFSCLSPQELHSYGSYAGSRQYYRYIEHRGSEKLCVVEGKCPKKMWFMCVVRRALRLLMLSVVTVSSLPQSMDKSLIKGPKTGSQQHYNFTA